MIALEILDYFRSEQIAYGCTPFLLEMYNEAITELEALQQPKSCDGCKHYKFTYNSNDGAVRQLMTTCSDCFRRLNRDNYEPKE